MNAVKNNLFGNNLFEIKGIKIFNYEQQVTSAETCRNQKAAGARLIQEVFDMPIRVLDFGGGKYSEAQDYINALGGFCNVYDPYNRTHEQNIDALSQKYDLMMCNNVLNVLTDDVLHHVVEDMKKVVQLCEIKSIIVTVYERDGSGVGCYTGKNSYQRNQKITDYLAIFSDFADVKKHKKSLLVTV